jgi:DNA recombination protein RmuC
VTDAAVFVGIVVVFALGAALAALVLRARNAGAQAHTTQPLADALARIETQLREMEAQRQQGMGGLEANLLALNRETTELSRALRAPNTRGRWGELTLRRVAELAGMTPFCDFTEQQSEDGKRPDMIVRLPGSRTLAVDAKAPLAGYLDAEAAPDLAQRNAALDRHAQQLRRHVDALAGREYWAQFDPAPEMVVLFLPGEHFLSGALERDRELLERALTKKVMLATPVTLVSVLKGVAYGWRQERLTKNAEELRRIAEEFQDRARIFAAAYADSGRQLAHVVEAYNRSVASWDSRLLPSLKRMKELGVGAADPPEPPRIAAGVRVPQPVEPLVGEPDRLASAQRPARTADQ